MKRKAVVEEIQSTLIKSLAETANDVIIAIGFSGEVIYCNEALSKVYEWEKEEILGKPFILLMPENEHDQFNSIRQGVLFKETIQFFDCKRVKKGGKTITVSATFSPIIDSMGKIIGISSIEKIIPEQIKIKRKSDELIETAPDAIIIVNHLLQIILANAQTEKLFKFSKSEILGKEIDILLPLEIAQTYKEHLRNYFDDPKILSIELFGRKKDGREFPIEISISPLIMDDITYISLAVRDITEREKLITLKNDFISIVSHELRSPLTSIIGSLGLILGNHSATLNEETKKYLDIAYRNSKTLVSLISDILDIEKIEAGKMNFNFEIVDFAVLIPNLIEVNQFFIEQQDVNVIIDQPYDSLKVLADYQRLVQVLANLLSNAIKFSSPGQSVIIKAEKYEEKIRISVIDQGSGIPEEFQDKLFQKFTQLDTSNQRQRRGTGLGLSIAKMIMKSMKGHIGFSSKTGEGSTFYIEMPVANH